MKTYIGVKIVQAEPEQKSHGPAGAPGWELHDGYKVVYPDGYVSWSPAAVFEAAYRLVSDEERALIDVPAETFGARLIAEHAELTGRLGKLAAFIDSEKFTTLDGTSRNLLIEQRAHMDNYRSVLDERMSQLGIAATGKPAAPQGAVHDAGDRDEIIESRVTGGGSEETPIPFKEN